MLRALCSKILRLLASYLGLTPRGFTTTTRDIRLLASYLGLTPRGFTDTATRDIRLPASYLGLTARLSGRPPRVGNYAVCP